MASITETKPGSRERRQILFQDTVDSARKVLEELDKASQVLDKTGPVRQRRYSEYQKKDRLSRIWDFLTRTPIIPNHLEFVFDKTTQRAKYLTEQIRSIEYDLSYFGQDLPGEFPFSGIYYDPLDVNKKPWHVRFQIGTGLPNKLSHIGVEGHFTNLYFQTTENSKRTIMIPQEELEPTILYVPAGKELSLMMAVQDGPGSYSKYLHHMVWVPEQSPNPTSVNSRDFSRLR